jgi:hypothetical protein
MGAVAGDVARSAAAGGRTVCELQRVAEALHGDRRTGGRLDRDGQRAVADRCVSMSIAVIWR